MPVRPDLELCIFVFRVRFPDVPGERRRVESLQLLHQLPLSIRQRVAIPHRRQPARRDDLRFEAVWQHRVDVVAQQVP
ncbi:MAG: hypothetical protein HY329_22290 [Chloroflexi bacterium]|nr:hypothetical protein [Chloroflexota bacterium]